jgi:carotenoid 1,2-hydratase
MKQSFLAQSGPSFDCDVNGDGGYVWWYVDGLCDDGVHGLTFIGSVFSPYYAWSGWKDPFQHCAINVALYRLDGARGRWAMTERGRNALERDATHFQVGPSSLRWEDGVLVADICETTMPIPSKLIGQIKLHPQTCPDVEIELAPEGRHKWRPLAPRARIELCFSSPNLNWSGDGYFDSNYGVEPLERGFVNWHWGRTHVGKDVALFYDVARRDGTHAPLALHVDHQGGVREVDSPESVHLPSTFWGIKRRAWRDTGAPMRVMKTLEDTPFYARSALATHIDGAPVTMMHESLNLDRLKNPIVRAMLPFRMPRVGG